MFRAFGPYLHRESGTTKGTEVCSKRQSQHLATSPLNERRWSSKKSVIAPGLSPCQQPAMYLIAKPLRDRQSMTLRTLFTFHHQIKDFSVADCLCTEIKLRRLAYNYCKKTERKTTNHLYWNRLVQYFQHNASHNQEALWQHYKNSLYFINVTQIQII